MIRPILMVSLLFSMIFSFTDFNTIWIITKGGPYDQTQVLSTYAYQLGVNAGYLGKGASISLFMFPIMAAMVFFMLQFLRGRHDWTRPHGPLAEGQAPTRSPTRASRRSSPSRSSLSTGASITSLKADANLYDLKANPFWFAKHDRTTGSPYHKDIIVPASRRGVHPLEIPPGAHTTRSDSEQNPKPIALIGDQPIVSPGGRQAVGDRGARRADRPSQRRHRRDPRREPDARRTTGT